MDKHQAQTIQQHLLKAADAIDDAAEVILTLSKDDRSRFAVHLGEVVTALHFGILAEVYDQYPELRPPDERPVISSFLKWEDVSLPNLVSEEELDALILSVLHQNWRKTAMIIGTTLQLTNARGWQLDEDTLSAASNSWRTMGSSTVKAICPSGGTVRCGSRQSNAGGLI